MARFYEINQIIAITRSQDLVTFCHSFRWLNYKCFGIVPLTIFDLFFGGGRKQISRTDLEKN